MVKTKEEKTEQIKKYHYFRNDDIQRRINEGWKVSEDKSKQIYPDLTYMEK